MTSRRWLMVACTAVLFAACSGTVTSSSTHGSSGTAGSSSSSSGLTCTPPEHYADGNAGPMCCIAGHDPSCCKGDGPCCPCFWQGCMSDALVACLCEPGVCGGVCAESCAGNGVAVDPSDPCFQCASAAVQGACATTCP